MITDNIVVVAHYNTALAAEIAKNILACAGIPSNIEYEGENSLRNYGTKVGLTVLAEHSEQARTLLRIHE